jgi:hypothetical protein
MDTIIKFFDVTNRDENNNAVEITDFNLCGILILPRIGENVFLNENKRSYVVSEIQHVFDKESDIETKHVVYINLK